MLPPGERHSTGTEPGLQSWFWKAMPISPPG
jgi:hypothetical protein